jgi:enamine deaminase RidA (YjgF/YER057c/UK114 family)
MWRRNEFAHNGTSASENGNEPGALLSQLPAEDLPLIRTNVASGYPFEDAYGYARAVRVGDHVFVSGTTARPPHLDGDAYAQMTNAIAIVAVALGEAGAELRHVVRTVVYVRDMADIHDVARAHRETFGESRPASTLVQVAALTPKEALVEIEVTALVHDGCQG